MFYHVLSCFIIIIFPRNVVKKGGFDSPRSGQMTWEQFEGQLDNPVMEATNRTRQRQSGDDRLQYHMIHM